MVFLVYNNVCGITDDSRQVKTGYLFVALQGAKQDGHFYIEEAVHNGAVAIISDQIEEHACLPVIAVKNARKTLAFLLNLFYDNPSKKLQVIGVTGTNGKTTTTCMIDYIFQQTGKKTGLIGTVWVKIDEDIRIAHLTTPDAKELQEIFAQMVEKGVIYSTMEVSSQGLAMHRVDGINFAVGVVTNLTLDHLDCHPTFADYLTAKERFFRMLAQEKAIFLNADDQLVLAMKKNATCHIFTYALENEANFMAKEVVVRENSSSFLFTCSSEVNDFQGKPIAPLSFPINLQVLGRHNVYNALSAAAVGIYYGLEPEIIQAALNSFLPVERRMEMIYDKEIKILDDTALNPASIDAVFQVVEKMKYQNLIVVNAVRGNRSKEVNQENGRTLAIWLKKLGVEHLYATSSREAVGELDRVKEDEKEAFCCEIERAKIKLEYFERLDKTIERAVSKLKKGDLLLLLGAQGMDDGAQLAIKYWEKN